MTLKIDVRQKSILKSWLVNMSLLSVVTGCAVGGAVEHHSAQPELAMVNELPAADAGRMTTPGGLPDFATLAKRIGPAVVNVSTTYIRQNVQATPSPSTSDDTISRFWQHFYDQVDPDGQQKQTGVGSGVVVDRDGTIVTNFHVVDGAEKIRVTLTDGKQFDAEVLGKDQKTDIAVIKISAPQSLPTVSLGDSDRLEVGEWVMAIGNPFGLEHTVTSGIVSAKGRHIGAGLYDDFIQTDAKINPGNSGGPLVNMRGEVVGINTAILSESGGNIGIGFAIPANLVKEILPQLRSAGRVVRGYVGIEVQEITPEIADALGLTQAGGALVNDVDKGGPAEHAGIKTGDIIVAFNGKAVKAARLSPGSAVSVKITRDDRPITLTVIVNELNEDEVGARSSD
jgi:serine protease Do